MTIMDKNLYNLLLDTVKSLISNLEAQENLQIEKKDITFYRPTHSPPTKNSSANLTIFEEKKIVNDFPNLIIRNRNQIDSAKSAEFENHMNVKYKEQKRPNLLLDFLMNYFELVDELTLDQAQFDLLYSKFQNYLTKKSVQIRMLTLVPNLVLESQEIEIGKNEKLIPINETDFNSIYDITLDKNYLHKLLLPGYGTIFQQEITEPLGPNKNPLSSISRDLLLTSLKLFSAGDITLHNSIAEIANPFYSTFAIVSKDRIPLENLETNFLLSEDKEKSFGDFYKLVKKVRPKFSNFIDQSLYRFEGSYLRKSDDDKLVDLLIALESLFLQQGLSDSKELALYIAWLIGSDFKERTKIYKFIGEVYDYRNVIVHGSNSKNTTKFRKNLQSKLEILKDYYRKSIKQFINKKLHSLSKEKLSKKLTELILGK